MTPGHQRFCPLCDRSFADGEAVLRCQGCGVMHHPACWVKNGGCATKTEHQSVPTALAYAAGRSAGEPARHPGEGTRVAPRASGNVEGGAAPTPSELDSSDLPPEPLAAGELPEEGLVIGGATSAGAAAAPHEPATAPRQPRKPPVAPKRYVAGPGGGRKPMPSLYGRHRLLGYWYIPAALLVAVGVALGVIWVVGLVTGDDSDSAAGGNSDDASTAAAGGAASPTASNATQTGTATAEVTSSTGGKFQINDVVVVTGAGAGSGSEAGCLNVRTAPGTDSTIIDCLRDGTQLTILGGPQEAGGLTWWNVKLASGNGWAAEEYLATR